MNTTTLSSFILFWYVLPNKTICQTPDLKIYKYFLKNLEGSLFVYLIGWLVGCNAGLTLRLLWLLKSSLLSPERRDDIDDMDKTNEAQNFLRTFLRLYGDFLRLSEDLQMTFWGLSKYFLGTFWAISESFWLPSKDFFKTFRIFLRRFNCFWGLFEYFLRTFLRTF